LTVLIWAPAWLDMASCSSGVMTCSAMPISDHTGIDFQGGRTGWITELGQCRWPLDRGEDSGILQSRHSHDHVQRPPSLPGRTQERVAIWLVGSSTDMVPLAQPVATRRGARRARNREEKR
jgi:hypothetical protein